MEKKERKIAALMQGHTIPFNALFVIRVWDKTQDGAHGEGERDQERDQLDEQRAVLREQPAEHVEESLLPDVAGLDVGPLRSSQALRGTSLSRRHAAGERDVHRTSRNRRSDLRRQRREPCRHQDVLRLGRRAIAAARRVARHERRREVRHRVRPAFADRALLRLHRHH